MDKYDFPRRAWPVALLVLVAISCSNETAKAPETAEKAKETAAVTVPPGALPLSAVLQAVENSGHAPVVEVEFEKDHWKVKAYKGDQLVQLNVDLMKGEILPAPVPTLDKPLSAVVKSLEDQGYGPIVDVERAEGEGGWEVEAYKGKSEVKMKVAPGSGKVTIGRLY